MNSIWSKKISTELIFLARDVQLTATRNPLIENTQDG